MSALADEARADLPAASPLTFVAATGGNRFRRRSGAAYTRTAHHDPGSSILRRETLISYPRALDPPRGTLRRCRSTWLPTVSPMG